MVEACSQKFGRVDILVNNVGGSAPGGPVELSEEEWDAQIDYQSEERLPHLQAVLPMMVDKAVAIVNTASTSGLRWTGSAQVAYAACKAGVIQLSRVVAVEYASKGVRVNTVVPGQMHTPMVEARLAGSAPAVTSRQTAGHPGRAHPDGLHGRWARHRQAALFLASDEARFITGTEIVVDGGMIARCD